MISLTTDPESDTPEVLKSYAARFGARDGWVFLTGAKTDVKKILDRLGNVFPVREQHLTYLILGDVAAARWRKIQANIPEEAIAGWVTALADERE